MDENRGNNQGGNNKGRKNGQNMLWFVLATVVVLLLVTMITNGIGSLTNQEITYSKFQTMVKEHKVKSVVITNSQIDIEPVKHREKVVQRVKGSEKGAQVPGELIAQEEGTVCLKKRPDFH